MTTHKLLETEQAGALSVGDQFKFQPGGFGTTWMVFTFRGHIEHQSGNEWVSCYGGDPDPKGDRAWRSFDVERIRKEAEPAGSLARKAGRLTVPQLAPQH